MNCKEVFDLFEKCGGKMICNYRTKQCVVQQTNLKCTINNKKDSEELDWLIWKNTANVSGVKNNSLKIENNIHRFQSNDYKGIVIDLLK